MPSRWSTTLLASALLALSACAPTATGAPVSSAPEPGEEPAMTEAAAPTHIKLGLLNFMSHAPLYIADQLGYFADQGLDVELVSFGANDFEMIPSLVQGQIDVAATTIRSATFSAIAQGSPVKFVADKGFLDPDAGCAADALVARPGILEAATLASPAGLKGLRVTGGTGTLSQMALESLLEQEGLSMADVEVVTLADFGSRVEALQTSALDVTVLSEPWLTRARNAGAGEVWLPFAEIFPRASVAAIMFGPAMFDHDPDVGVRFMAAYLMGVETYRRGKTDDNVKTAVGFTRLPEEEVREMCWPSFRADGTLDTVALLAFQEWAVASGQLDAVLPVSAVYDPSYVEAAAEMIAR